MQASRRAEPELGPNRQTDCRCRKQAKVLNNRPSLFIRKCSEERIRMQAHQDVPEDRKLVGSFDTIP